jgi:uncharacterized lipoprotein YmbA
MKTALALLAAAALGACATAPETQRSYTPRVEVVVRAPNVRGQADYRTSPEESSQGLGGASR